MTWLLSFTLDSLLNLRRDKIQGKDNIPYSVQSIESAIRKRYALDNPQAYVFNISVNGLEIIGETKDLVKQNVHPVVISLLEGYIKDSNTENVYFSVENLAIGEQVYEISTFTWPDKLKL